jgi:outer membrane protein assembly factor BamB
MADTVTVGGLARRYRDLGNGRLTERLTDYSRRVLAPRGRKILSKHIRATTRKRRGDLERSPRTFVTRAANTVQTRLFSKHPAARTLGKVGKTTIRSRRSGGRLAIPLGEALDASGTARFGGPRQDPTPMYAARTRDGRVFLFDAETGRPRWQLVVEVTVQGRGFLKKARNEWQREAGRLARRYTARLLRGEA